MGGALLVEIQTKKITHEYKPKITNHKVLLNYIFLTTRGHYHE